MSTRREFLHPTFARQPVKEAAFAGFDYPSTAVGTTGNISVYYATSLGASGQTLANALLGQVAGPYSDMEAFFGISGGSVTVVVAPLSGKNDGSGGAYHWGCDFTSGGTLYLDATFALPNATDVEIALYVAELSECFMGAQGKGWVCNYSNGEGLSRFCAEVDTPPGSFPSWGITGPSWVHAGYPDWVSTTEQTDGDYISTGCAILYIYWMVFLGYTTAQVIQAGGATLAANYQALTGKTTAYADLKAAVAAVTVTSDNPFGAKWNNAPALSVAAACQQGGSRGAQLWGIDTSGQLRSTFQETPGGPWSGWSGVWNGASPGQLTSITAAQQNNGTVRIWAVNTQHVVYSNAQTSPGGDWGGWTS